MDALEPRDDSAKPAPAPAPTIASTMNNFLWPEEALPASVLVWGTKILPSLPSWRTRSLGSRGYRGSGLPAGERPASSKDRECKRNLCAWNHPICVVADFDYRRVRFLALDVVECIIAINDFDREIAPRLAKAPRRQR